MGRFPALIKKVIGLLGTNLLPVVFLFLAACSPPKAEDYQAKEKVEKPTGSVSINDGATTTTDLNVTVKFSSSVAAQVYVTNVPKCTSGGAWETLAASKAWVLTKTGVANTIYVKFKDSAGVESNCYSASITHVVSGTFSLASPAPSTYINSSNVSNFTLVGGCVNEGQNVTIKVTGLTEQTAVCTNGTWTKSMNLTSHGDGSVTFTLGHSDLAPLYKPFIKDTVAPTASTFVIAGGAAAVSSLNTTLAMTATSAAEMYISNTSCTAGGAWETFATSKNWTLANTDATNTVYFKVKDIAGNESSCLNDSVLHDSVVPTVTIDAPVAGIWINNTNRTAFPLSGTCSEVGATVSLTITGQALTTTATCSASNTWSRNWSLTTLADNSSTPYQINASITRPSGNQGTASKSYYKDVVLPTAPSFTNLPAISDNATNITVSSADATQYRYLIIEAGDSATCATTTAAFSSDALLSAPLVYTLTNQGAYKVCARSVDAAGNVSSATTAGTWTRDTQAPSVLAVTSSNADGTYDVASVITVKVTFDETVIVTGNPTLTLETGTTDRTATYSAGSNSKTLSFTYTVVAGDAAADLDYVATTSLSLAGGTIKDANNFDAILTLPAPGNMNSLAGQKNIAIVDAGNLVPTLTDYPTGNSSDVSLYVAVSGGTITQYKYAIITSGSCASATFSAAVPKATRITASLTGYADGSNMKLCVIGGNASNTFQNNNSATVVSWVKDARVFASITSPAQNRVVEGSGSQIVTISLSAAKAADVTIHYRVGGDAVNPTHHNATSGSVVIPAGSTSQTVTVNFPENAVADGEKLLNFHLTGAIPSAGVTFDKNYQAQYYIKDNDTAFSVSKYAMGRSHACAITSDNALRCYGHNSYGQVGDGTNLFKETGVIIKAGTPFAQVAVGQSHTCAVTTLGALYCWGDNSKNQIGNGTVTPSNIPVAIDIANSYLSVSAGANHTCAITTTNKLRCWGYNGFSNLGDGSNLNASLPVNIDASENYSFVAAGSESTCAITADSYLKCWGRNANSQLGDGGSATVTTPIAIDSSVKYKNVSMGSGHACGVTLAGVMKCWGANTAGQLGNNTVVASTTPIEIDNLVTYDSVTVNDDSTTDTNQGFTCGLTLANTLKCWGHNQLMQLADGSSTNRLLPVASDSGTLYTSVTAAGSRACGVTSDGGLKCWGSLDGELTRGIHPLGSGNGGKYFINRFKNINLGFTFAAISGYSSNTADASSSSCGIESNKLYCWGTTNAATATGDGTANTAYRRPAPIWLDPETQYASLPSTHLGDKCALTTGGIIKCWGKNDYGELGLVPATSGGYVTRPQVADSTNQYSAIFMNGSTCGITTTGILKCMGRNNVGQIGDGNNPTNATAMTTVDPGVTYLTASLGQTHACGITSANVLKCWGQNGASGAVGNNSTLQVNTPTVIDFGVQYKKVSSSGSSNCAITVNNKLKCWGFAGLNKVLGFNDTTDRLVPTLVDSTNDYTDVQITETHACAIRTDGELFCWGQRLAFGYFTGNLEALSITSIAGPQRVDTGVTYTTLALRAGSTCAKTTGGQWRCAGRFYGDNLGFVDSGRNNTVSATPGQYGFHNPTYIHKDLGF